jgi:hypothetical protein
MWEVSSQIGSPSGFGNKALISVKTLIYTALIFNGFR